jgi:hypothetical protein
VTHHCRLSQRHPTHRRPLHRLRFLHHRLKGPDDVETRWNYLETTRKTRSLFSYRYLLRLRCKRLLSTLPRQRQRQLQQQSLLFLCRQRPERTYQPRLSRTRLRRPRCRNLHSTWHHHQHMLQWKHVQYRSPQLLHLQQLLRHRLHRHLIRRHRHHCRGRPIKKDGIYA